MAPRKGAVHIFPLHFDKVRVLGGFRGGTGDNSLFATGRRSVVMCNQLMEAHVDERVHTHVLLVPFVVRKFPQPQRGIKQAHRELHLSRVM